ncbi:MAG: methionyl-tRNA formyltransferase [Burkholderiaceae bacterium]
MKIIFAGTPDFAAAALAALIEAGYEIPLVLSQPDRPAGRGMKLTASPVKQLALQHGLTVATPLSLSLKKGGEEAAAAHELLRAAKADVMVVAAYGLILPQTVLDIPRGIGGAGAPGLKAINIHASLLPRWRGAAPITRAIEAGDAETGITLMQMDAGLDTGPMLLERRTPIGPDATSATLTTQLAAMGAALLLDGLRRADQLVAQAQPEAGVTYAHKIAKTEARVDWTRPAAEIERQIRAFDPFPAAAATLRETPIKLWRARVLAASSAAAPGRVIAADAAGVSVATGAGVLQLTELQRPGAKRLPAREFLAGFPVAAAEKFE